MNLAENLESIAEELRQYANALREGYVIDVIDLMHAEKRLHQIITGED